MVRVVSDEPAGSLLITGGAAGAGARVDLGSVEVWGAGAGAGEDERGAT